SELAIIELRDRVNGYPTLHSIVFGATGYLFHSLETAWVVWHALLPTLIWLLVYKMCRVLSGSLVYCSAASWIVTLVPFGPRNLLLLGEDSWIQPLEISRMPHPALSFFVLLLALFLTSEALALGGRLRLVGAGLVCGLLFNAYYFYWIGLFLGFGI